MRKPNIAAILRWLLKEMDPILVSAFFTFILFLTSTNPRWGNYYLWSGVFLGGFVLRRAMLDNKQMARLIHDMGHELGFRGFMIHTLQAYCNRFTQDEITSKIKDYFGENNGIDEYHVDLVPPAGVVIWIMKSSVRVEIAYHEFRRDWRKALERAYVELTARLKAEGKA